MRGTQFNPHHHLAALPERLLCVAPTRNGPLIGTSHFCFGPWVSPGFSSLFFLEQSQLGMTADMASPPTLCGTSAPHCQPAVTEASLRSFQGCRHTAWRKTPNEVAESCCAMSGWGSWCAPGVPPNERPWDGCRTCPRLTQMPEWESSFLISFSSIWGKLLKLSPASSYSSGKWDDEKILLLWVI